MEDVSSAASSHLHNEGAQVKEGTIPWIESLIKRAANGKFHNVIHDAESQPVSLVQSAPYQAFLLGPFDRTMSSGVASNCLCR